MPKTFLKNIECYISIRSCNASKMTPFFQRFHFKLRWLWAFFWLFDEFLTKKIVFAQVLGLRTSQTMSPTTPSIRKTKSKNASRPNMRPCGSYFTNRRVTTEAHKGHVRCFFSSMKFPRVSVKFPRVFVKFPRGFVWIT